MKNIALLLGLFFIFSCGEKGKKVGEYMSYGKEITETDALTQAEMLEKYDAMAIGDTLDIKFKSQIKEVCQQMGCWTKLALNEDTENMVVFKDHGFFIPKDSDGKEAIVEGKAFLKEVSVDELKHYAKDAGESDEEIEKITEPKLEYQFVADGILVK